MKEEKTDLLPSDTCLAEAAAKRGLLEPDIQIIKTLFFSFVFFSQFAAQVPLNGFCRFQEFSIKPNFNRLFAVDYNRDGYRGLVVFNPNEKKYLTGTYDAKSKQFKQSEKYSSFALTNILPLGKDQRGNAKYAFTSRKDRTAGMLSFSKTGAVTITSKIKFDSYPNNIDASDLDKDGNPELLISGASFNGLSILKDSKSGLKESNFGDNTAFSYSSFIDLDYDSFDDIAAVDIFTNSIKLFYNDGTGSFTKQRSVNLESEVSEFRASDINLDGFTDFIFIKNKHVEILYGDSVSSFQKGLVPDRKSAVDKYTVFDFNGDGYNDIACINIDEGILSILFAASADSFYPPFVYFKRKGIVDLTAYVDRGGRKLCILDKNGNVYLINKAIDFSDVSLAVGIKPSLVGSFNYLNDRSLDYYTIDEESMQLKFFLSAGNNLFDKYLSYSLSKNYKRIAVDGQHPYKKTFYCYSPGERMIEIVSADLDNDNFSRRILYADGSITDLKLEDNKSREGQTIHLLINNKATLYLQSFEFRDFRYLRSGLDSISTNVESAASCFGSDKEVFFYTKFGNTLYLNKTTVKSGTKKIINISSIQLTEQNNISYEIACFDDKDLNERPAVSLINENGNTRINMINRGYHKTISIDGFYATPGYVKYYNEKDGNKLFLYNKVSGKLKKIVLRNNFYTYNINDVFESKTVNSYIVAPINNKNECLIYSDTANNLIILKAIQ